MDVNAEEAVASIFRPIRGGTTYRTCVCCASVCLFSVPEDTATRKSFRPGVPNPWMLCLAWGCGPLAFVHGSTVEKSPGDLRAFR